MSVQTLAVLHSLHFGSKVTKQRATK